MRLLPLTALSFLLLTGVASAELYEPAGEPFVAVVVAGQPQAQIVVPARPASLEEFAASELQAYLARISGAELPVVEESQRDATQFAFFLGNTRKSKKSGIVASEKTMGRDGFALQSVENGLIVLGRNDLGTLFGVYELLERYFDVRWFMPGDLGECVPTKATLRVGQIDLTFKPSFRVRWVGKVGYHMEDLLEVTQGAPVVRSDYFDNEEILVV